MRELLRRTTEKSSRGGVIDWPVRQINDFYLSDLPNIWLLATSLPWNNNKKLFDFITATIWKRYIVWEYISKEITNKILPACPLETCQPIARSCLVLCLACQGWRGLGSQRVLKKNIWCDDKMSKLTTIVNLPGTRWQPTRGISCQWWSTARAKCSSNTEEESENIK